MLPGKPGNSWPIKLPSMTEEDLPVKIPDQSAFLSNRLSMIGRVKPLIDKISLRLIHESIHRVLTTESKNVDTSDTDDRRLKESTPHGLS